MSDPTVALLCEALRRADWPSLGPLADRLEEIGDARAAQVRAPAGGPTCPFPEGWTFLHADIRFGGFPQGRDDTTPAPVNMAWKFSRDAERYAVFTPATTLFVRKDNPGPVRFCLNDESGFPLTAIANGELTILFSEPVAWESATFAFLCNHGLDSQEYVVTPLMLQAQRALGLLPEYAP